MMTTNLTVKFEIQVGTPNQRELIESGIFALKHRCPVLVVPPEAVQAAIVDRSTRNGQYIIVAAVDFPNGKSYALEKMRDIPQDAYGADGFEIVLSRDRSEAHCRNEIKAIFDLIKQSNPAAEISFVLNNSKRKDAETLACCDEFKARRPGIVRTEADLFNAIPIKAVTAAVELIRSRAPVSVKVSGIPARGGEEQLKRVQELLAIPGVSRVGLGLEQAKSIQRAAAAPPKKEEPATKTDEHQVS